MKEAERALSVRREIQFSQYNLRPPGDILPGCAAKGLKERLGRQPGTLASNRYYSMLIC